MNPLGRLLRQSIHATCALLVLSGLAWALLHHAPELAGLDHRAARDWAILLMKLHGAAAMLVLVLLGSLLGEHVARGWKLRRNQASGSLVLALAALLMITGYLLYYAGGESFRQATSWVHLLLGVVAPIPFALHLHVRRQPAQCYTARPSAERGVPR